MLGPNTISNSEILKKCDLAQNNGWSENSTVAWAIIAFSRNMDLKKVEKEVEMNSFFVHLKFAFTHNEKTLSFKKSKWFWIVMDQITQNIENLKQWTQVYPPKLKFKPIRKTQTWIYLLRNRPNPEKKPQKN